MAGTAPPVPSGAPSNPYVVLRPTAAHRCPAGCSAEARCPGRWRAAGARGFEGAREPKEQVVAVTPSGEGQAHWHADVAHGAHEDGDSGDPEVSDDQVAVRDPHTV